jgi:curved DNA-binding protein CbpA
LRQIGGIAPEEVDRYLERWAKEGIILVQGSELARAEPDAGDDAEPDPEAGPAAASGASRETRAEIDGALDLSVELQQRILDFESSLDQSYHDLLGVDRSATTKDIKLAYFRLSKEYHPDRYFRRNIGTYALRLDRIFKRVCEAYELLSDPATRAEIERHLIETGPPTEGAYSGAGGTREQIGPDPSASPSRRPRGPQIPMRVRNLQRLRARFKVPKKALVERQFKARQFYDSARAAAHEKRWLEAAASMRLAIAFDPANPEYKIGFAEIQADVHRVRAEKLIAQAAGADAQGDALKLLEEALNYRPMDVALNRRAAEICLDLNELDRAREYAEILCEVEPDEAGQHALLARVLRRLGLRERARRALDRADELDPNHPDVAAERRQERRPGRR